MKLGTKFSIFINIFVLVSVSFFAGTTIITRVGEIKNELLAKDEIISSGLTRDLSEFLAIYYYTQFPAFADSVAEKFRKYEDLVNIRIINPEGLILFESSELEHGRYEGFEDRRITDNYLLGRIKDSKESYDFTTYKGESVLRIIYPYIDSSQRHLTSVEFIYSLKIISDETKRIAILTIILLTSFMMFTFLSTNLFTRIITTSISELREGADQISKGNFDYRVKIKSKDEVGALAESFNKMAQDIKTSRTEIEEYNKKLEKEVADRTKELAQRIGELERLQKMTVDRELKMIELKNEVQKLKDTTD